MNRLRIAARTLGWLVALAALGWAIVVSVTGGFVLTIAGVRLSSHRIVPPYALAMIILFAGRKNRDTLAALAGKVESVSGHWVAAVATTAGALIVAIAFGAFTAAGDAFGYLSQATQWLEGRLFLPPGPALAFSWPSAVWAFSPMGYMPAPGGAALAPTYPAGLPLMMAAARRLFGSGAEFLVVPAAGAACVYLTYRFGRLCYDGAAGLIASILLLASPVFLFQLVQPMSDVPATAAWLLSIVAACEGGATGALGSGLAASLAILTRPNLAPLALPIGVFVLCARPLSHAAHEDSLPSRIRHAALFGVGLLPLCVIAGSVNAALYGSPFSSGYGRASDIYSLSNFLPNLARYPRWLLDTQTVFIVLAFAAPFVRRGVAASWLALAFVLTLFGCYALYMPFEHWSFLRFLLPGIPLLLVLAVGALTALAARAQRLETAVSAAVAVLLVLLGVQFAVRGDVFRLRAIERERFQHVGQVLSEREKNAIYLALVHTGTTRYYAGRDSVRFDLLPPAGLDDVIADLRRCGYIPYVLLGRNELALFRSRFSAHTATGQLDWKPTVLDADGNTLLFDLRQRPARAPGSPPMSQ